jgi:hypothetical protein
MTNREPAIERAFFWACLSPNGVDIITARCNHSLNATQTTNTQPEKTMKELHVGTSPLTNRIYAGHVLKDGCTWGANKADVTGEACGAVAQHVIANKGPVIVSCSGEPKYEISVRVISEA